MTLRERWTVLGVVLRVLIRCPELLYYLLPRGWRGGYRSPWLC
ncbi:MAG TPA: hypothetical protein VNO81_07800 [Candidatus Nitrosotenuis sp.]|nr:hypothetical protein [Candidatus Nitrosotenuis sp.]